MHISDIRGTVQLATQATAGVTRIVEGVHQSVWSTLGFPGGEIEGTTRGLTGAIYQMIHGATWLGGKSVDSLIGRLQILQGPDVSAIPDTPRRETLLSALNGVMGDRLAEDRNPFAIPMSLQQSIPATTEATGKVVLLIHGLCMTDLQNHARYKDLPGEHGAALASGLNYSPVYLRYNSGLHISINGRELSGQLEQLLERWPVAIEDLSVVAHSMGGLLIRSALHHGRQNGLRWPERIKNVVFLGTPHHGAPLERMGNWLDLILNAVPHAKPFAALGQVRSAGITDLRFGNVQHEDWNGHGRFQLKPDCRQPTLLPAHVNCYTIAAALAGKRSALADRLIGDGMVPLNSALGKHGEAERTLAFLPSFQSVFYGTNHMELLHKPEVINQVVEWLK